MKAIRHAKIKTIIENTVVETQEDLAEALRLQHIEVTQATVSRDIKEMMLIKIPTGDGRYRYAYPMEKNLVFSKISGSGRKLILVPVCLVLPSFGSSPSSSSMVGIPRS